MAEAEDFQNGKEKKNKYILDKNVTAGSEVQSSGITIEDLDKSPEEAVKEMDKIESSLGEVEKEVKEKAARVEKAVEENAEEIDEAESAQDDGAAEEEVPEEPEAPSVKPKTPEKVDELSAAKKMDGKTKEEMQKILVELRSKMNEIDKLTKELKEQKDELSKTPPKKTAKLLEEIDVPSLEMLK